MEGLIFLIVVGGFVLLYGVLPLVVESIRRPRVRKRLNEYRRPFWHD